MRFAAIADVHGNHLALEAVLTDISAHGVNEIVDLGDMASGPLDARVTLDRLIALNATHILGNHDRYLISQEPELMGKWDYGAHAQLSEHHLQWLQNLPAKHVYRGRVLLCHAMPDSDEVYWLEDVAPDGSVTLASQNIIERGAAGVEEGLILCAHSHVPRTVRLADGRLIVNPGSVGMPAYRDVHPYPHVMQMGSPHARYAIVEEFRNGWNVTFRHVPYDHATTAELALRNGHPELAYAIATGWMIDQ